MFRNWRFFPFREMATEKKNSGELWLWLLVHLSIPLLLLLSILFMGRSVSVNTSLLDMLPRSSHSIAVMEADNILAERNGREIIILSAALDFENAKKGALLLYAEFENSPDFENISLYFNSEVIEDFYRYIYDYRFVIAGNDTLVLLESGRVEEIAQDALALAFGAFNFVPLDNIATDPFLLTQRRINDFFYSSLLSGGNMMPKDNVLAAEKDGTWYVLLRLTLSPHAVSLQSGRNIIGRIYSTAEILKKSIENLEFYFSGVPFHSYESSSSAQREISLISTVMLLIILLLFLYIFRTPLPVFFSIIDVGISLGLAAAALLVFREIHIITFVFGTTLIGTCIDYSVHFFTHWKGNPDLENGFKIRRHISKSIIMGFISTEICFFIFLFAPFPILKQFAVFSMVGLLSSFLTCFCIYPRLKMPENEKRQFQIFSGKIFLKLKGLSLPRHVRIVLLAALVVASAALLIFNFSSVKIKNDLSSLYTMSPFLMESERRTAQVLDYGFSGWYFIVSGSSPEETLRNEENLAIRLEEERLKGNMRSFLGTSLFVPSIKTQQRTYEAMKNLLPLSAAQFEYLGFPPQYAEAFEKEFASAAERYCLIEDAPYYTGVSNLWIGEQGGSYYSCVILVNPADEALFRAIAEEFDYVYFINKQKDISRDLDTLTRTILVFFLVACIVIFVIIRFVYPLRDSLKIYAVPVFLILTTVAVLAANSIPIGFFSAAALVLVFGLGLDYIFYMTGRKKEKNNLTLLGVALSFLTTLLSFGALAFSGFMPVHIFGLTVSAGLGAAFISAVSLQSRDN